MVSVAPSSLLQVVLDSPMLATSMEILLAGSLQVKKILVQTSRDSAPSRLAEGKTWPMSRLRWGLGPKVG